MEEKDNISELTKLAQMVNGKSVTDDDFFEMVRISNTKQDINANKKQYTPKKKIKGYSKKGFKKVFTIAASCLLLGIAANEGYHNLKEYEENAYTNSLNAVKTAIAENTLGISNPDSVTLHDNSKRLGSSHDLESYIIKVNGKEYAVYNRDIIDGYTTYYETIKNDTINNPELIDAMQIVFGAQDGNFFKAWRANGLTKNIKLGKLDLGIKNEKSNERKEDVEEER